MNMQQVLHRMCSALALWIVAGAGLVAACQTESSQSQPAAPPASQPQTRPGPERSTVAPLARTTDNWMMRTGSYTKQARRGNIDIVFLGDSITQSWESEGKGVWETYYGKRKAANFGISGDRTENLMWRVTNGNLAFPADQPPKLAVLMIGTNNSGGDVNSAQEIADGITAIVTTIREKLPNTKVLLLAIFPRSQSPGAQRAKIIEASAIASKIADGTEVIYLDIGKEFLNEDGTISPQVMPDYLHLSAEGYERWAMAIEPTVKKILGD